MDVPVRPLDVLLKLLKRWCRVIPLRPPVRSGRGGTGREQRSCLSRAGLAVASLNIVWHLLTWRDKVMEDTRVGGVFRGDVENHFVLVACSRSGRRRRGRSAWQTAPDLRLA